jgi:hypothetical protein
MEAGGGSRAGRRNEKKPKRTAAALVGTEKGCSSSSAFAEQGFRFFSFSVSFSLHPPSFLRLSLCFSFLSLPAVALLLPTSFLDLLGTSLRLSASFSLCLRRLLSASAAPDGPTPARNAVQRPRQGVTTRTHTFSRWALQLTLLFLAASLILFSCSPNAINSSDHVPPSSFSEQCAATAATKAELSRLQNTQGHRWAFVLSGRRDDARAQVH